MVSVRITSNLARFQYSFAIFRSIGDPISGLNEPRQNAMQVRISIIGRSARILLPNIGGNRCFHYIDRAFIQGGGGAACMCHIGNLAMVGQRIYCSGNSSLCIHLECISAYPRSRCVRRHFRSKRPSFFCIRVFIGFGNNRLIR